MPGKCGGTMRRVPEVIDCWFDSGCMPFAQWGYPHAGHKEMFEQSFPADFISEAIDQTRGWFYSLLMISTLVFDERRRSARLRRADPIRTRRASCSGTSATRRGRRRPSRKGNYTPPEIILDEVQMEFAVGDPARDGVQVARRDDAPSSRARTSRGSICSERREACEIAPRRGAGGASR